MIRERLIEQLHSLAEAAVWAPSADNHHVFRLRVIDDRLQLTTTPDFQGARALRRILALISLGAVAENIRLRGLRLGLLLEPTWRLDFTADPVIADFSCTPLQPSEDALEQAILRRHTNRRLRYRGPPLTAEERNQLAGECDSVPGTSLAWLDGTGRRNAALHLIRLAETERFRDRGLHAEMFGAIRFDVGWHDSAAEGIAPAALALPLIERPAFSLLRHWPVMKSLQLVGAPHLLGFRAAYLPCRLAPNLCAICADGPMEQAAVNAGRALQRTWLRATAQGLAVQPYAASALYALHTGERVIAPELRRMLADGWLALLDGRIPFMILRIGHAQGTTVRAGRPAPKEFLLQS